MSLHKYDKAKAKLDELRSRYNMDEIKEQHSKYRHFKRRKSALNEDEQNEFNNCRDGSNVYQQYLRAMNALEKHKPVSAPVRQPLRDITNTVVPISNNTTQVCRHNDEDEIRSMLSSEFCILIEDEQEVPNHHIHHENRVGVRVTNNIQEETHQERVSDEIQEESQQEIIRDDTQNEMIQDGYDRLRHCQNCKRFQYGNINGSRYSIDLVVCNRNEFIKRRKFFFVDKEFNIHNRDLEEDQMLLCPECMTYLTNRENKKSMTYRYMWPSFYWEVLSNKKIRMQYGSTLWRLRLSWAVAPWIGT